VNTFLQHLVQGTALGATYGLVALGYSMQFSAMRLVNFAHGETFMLGAFVVLTLNALGVNSYLASFILATIILGVIGAGIEKISIRPLYSSSDLNMFVATIGLAVVLRQIANVIWGADAQPFPQGFGSDVVDFGRFVATEQQVGTLIATFVLMLGFDLFLRRSKLGTAMRAVAQDDNTAALMGINVLRVKTIVFAISTSLAAAAGILFASLTFAVFDMGLWMGIKGFAAAVLGGLGSLPGAVVGGLVLGLLEQFGSGYISSLYREAISLGILVAVLLLRPQGILGKGSSAWGKV
jgi:branched-chain amino acid transport system permease protein